MPSAASDPARAVENDRDYLLLLVRLQLGSRSRAKLDASDVVQQAILLTHEKRDQFRGGTEGEWLDWLRAILANVLAVAARRLGTQARDHQPDRRARGRPHDQRHPDGARRLDLLGAFGQGGGTGALSLHDDRWPEAFRGSLLTGDWGRSEVYLHTLKPAAATFRADQGVFLSIPRPTATARSTSGTSTG